MKESGVYILILVLAFAVLGSGVSGILRSHRIDDLEAAVESLESRVHWLENPPWGVDTVTVYIGLHDSAITASPIWEKLPITEDGGRPIDADIVYEPLTGLR